MMQRSRDLVPNKPVFVLACESVGKVIVPNMANEDDVFFLNYFHLWYGMEWGSNLLILPRVNNEPYPMDMLDVLRIKRNNNLNVVRMFDGERIPV